MGVNNWKSLFHSAPRRGGRRCHRRLLAPAVFCLVCIPWSCCASPIRDLWPPKPGEPRRVIDVVFRDWHTVIVRQLQDSERLNTVSVKLGDLLKSIAVSAERYKDWRGLQNG